MMIYGDKLESIFIDYLATQEQFDLVISVGFDAHVYVYEIYLDLIGEIL